MVLESNKFEYYLCDWKIGYFSFVKNRLLNVCLLIYSLNVRINYMRCCHFVVLAGFSVSIIMRCLKETANCNNRTNS